MADLDDLQALNEADFRDEVIIPLFEEMGFNGVKNTHGSMEFGRDVVCYTVDPFGNRIWHGAQLKVEQIHGTKAGSGNYTEIQSQIRAALSQPYRHAVSGDEVYMTTMYVITSQDFTDEAEMALVEEFGDEPVYLIDGADLMEQIEEYRIPITDEEKFDQSIVEAREEVSFPRRIPVEGDGRSSWKKPSPWRMSSMVIASRLEKFTEGAIEHYEEETLLAEIFARRDSDEADDADRDFVQIGRRTNLPKEFFADEGYHNTQLAEDFARSVYLGERNFVLRSINENSEAGTATLDEFTYEQLTDVFESVENATPAFIPLYFHNVVHEWIYEDRLEFGTGITYVRTDGSRVKIHWLPDKTGFTNIFVLDSNRAEIVQKRFEDMPPMDQFEVRQEFQFNEADDRLMVYYGDIDDEEFDFLIRTLISDPFVDETSACVVDTSATGIELEPEED